MKWMGQDLLNNKITDQMEQMLERYPKVHQQMDQEKPEIVIIADPPIANTPATGSKGATEEEGLMEIVETGSEKQPEVEKLTEQIKEMKEKIELLEKEKYRKAAIELAKQLESINAEEEETSDEPFVEIVSEIRRKKKKIRALMFCPPRQYMLRLVVRMSKILRTRKNLRG
uniref:Uncharacterized protein n=1 Tax=Romanomermis culicivorax TaxID=13658 RepID=A0A915IC13_ROMCU